MKKIYFTIFTMFLCCIIVFSNIYGNNTSNQRHRIAGETLKAIHIAFRDYQNETTPNYRDQRYYIFTYTEVNNFLEIYISYNNDLLKKENKLLMTGGSARYLFDKTKNEIFEKNFFK